MAFDEFMFVIKKLGTNPLAVPGFKMLGDWPPPVPVIVARMTQVHARIPLQVNYNTDEKLMHLPETFKYIYQQTPNQRRQSTVCTAISPVGYIMR